MKHSNTKKALLGSVLSVLLCLSLLIGSTFAWFTDTATTGVNQIVSGKLDVELQMQDADGKWVKAEGETLNWVKAADAPEGEPVLWEPGCTYQLQPVKIINKGNLALKFQAVVNGAKGDVELLDVIDFTYDGVEMGKDISLLPEEEKILTITGHMKETATNDYMNKTVTDIAISVFATQDTVEFDSIDNQYDKDAAYVREVASADAFKAALAEVDANTVIRLKNDITTSCVIANDATIDLNGNTLTIGGAWVGEDKDPFLIQGGNVTFANGTIASDNDYKGIYAEIPKDGTVALTFDHVTFDYQNPEGSDGRMLELKAFDTKDIRVDFKGCTFNNACTHIWASSVFTEEPVKADVTFDKCIINNNRAWRAVLQIDSAGIDPDSTFTVKDCIFDITSLRTNRFEVITAISGPKYSITGNTATITSTTGKPLYFFYNATSHECTTADFGDAERGNENTLIGFSANPIHLGGK